MPIISQTIEETRDEITDYIKYTRNLIDRLDHCSAFLQEFRKHPNATDYENPLLAKSIDSNIYSERSKLLSYNETLTVISNDLQHIPDVSLLNNVDETVQKVEDIDHGLNRIEEVLDTVVNPYVQSLSLEEVVTQQVYEDGPLLDLTPDNFDPSVVPTPSPTFGQAYSSLTNWGDGHEEPISVYKPTRYDDIEADQQIPRGYWSQTTQGLQSGVNRLGTAAQNNAMALGTGTALLAGTTAAYVGGKLFGGRGRRQRSSQQPVFAPGSGNRGIIPPTDSVAPVRTVPPVQEGDRSNPVAPVRTVPPVQGDRFNNPRQRTPIEQTGRLSRRDARANKRRGGQTRF